MGRGRRDARGGGVRSLPEPGETAIERLTEKQADLLKAMAHPTRLRVLRLLAGRPWCVCDMSSRLGLEQPNLSQHLAILRRAGLVRGRREGLRMVYRLADPGVADLLETLDRWAGRGESGAARREGRELLWPI